MRAQLQSTMADEESERDAIHREVALQQERLRRLAESIKEKSQMIDEYDKTIREVEASYVKLVQSAQALNRVMRKETIHLQSRLPKKDAA